MKLDYIYIYIYEQIVWFHYIFCLLCLEKGYPLRPLVYKNILRIKPFKPGGHIHRFQTRFHIKFLLFIPLDPISSPTQIAINFRKFSGYEYLP